MVDLAASSRKLYSIRKSRHILHASYKWYKKEGKKLPADQLNFFETHLQALDQAILNQDRPLADSEAHIVEDFCQAHFKKSWWQHFLELLFAVMVALIVATVVRQMWFELYEIPTGSMRPTFKEQDHLTVTKTAFGLNTPLMTRHLYFDPNLIHRTGIVIWSGDQIPHLDSDSTFLGLFPYTKRYIKRCLGKPGDTLYFYGGHLYGFDQEGHDLVDLRENKWMDKIEHIPFINFEGRPAPSHDVKTGSTQITLHQFNQSIGRLQFSRLGTQNGLVFNGQQWVKDKPEAQKEPHSTIQTYSDFWGMRNFAMARLLSKKELEDSANMPIDSIGEGELYLELRHTPSLSFPKPLIFTHHILVTGYKTFIPLTKDHLKTLMDNMYTARFVVKDGHAERYRIEGTPFSKSSPFFPGVPDGTYEFYYGKAVKVGWGGITTDLPKDHPLYELSAKNVQRLFNLGIEMTTLVEPGKNPSPYFPNRYAYFREGDLYLVGAPILKKGDSTLEKFHQREQERQQTASSESPYVAFKDYGPPMKEGKLDVDFIKTFGLKIPEGHYLVLGDNHAMSLDSRHFGAIPQANLQGAPSLIIWPPGDRLGAPLQEPYQLITVPRLIVWGIALLIGLIWYLLYRRSLKRPVFKKL